MLKIFFIFITTVHGLIHLMGFVKAFNLTEVNQLTQPITRDIGILWLITAILFLFTLMLYLTKAVYWWISGLVAIVLSQVLIIQNWEDAKAGTVANIIILVPVFISAISNLPSSFQHIYMTEVQRRLRPITNVSLVSEKDLAPLPEPVQKYLRFVGAVGKPKIYNFRVVSQGKMKRSVKNDWINIKAQQYNFFDDLTRLFYIKSDLFGIPFDGLHAYNGNGASMKIRIAALFQIANAKGEKMDQSENVTLFNDMCLFAPATLINKNIEWEAVNSLTAKARFTHNNLTISATLYFNETGEMIDFSSDDRFLSGDGKTYTNYRWSTPVSNYQDFEGRKVAVTGDAIWHMPEGDFTYAKYALEKIEYNTKGFSLELA